MGCGSGPAISLAVRKIEDPMMPLTSSKTESSSDRPRTRLGAASDFAGNVGVATGISINHPSPTHRPIRAACRSGGRSPQSNRRKSADRKLLSRISDNREVRARPAAADLKP